MDSRVKIYLERAENKLIMAKTSHNISISQELKKTLGIPENETFFNDFISHCYYSQGR